MVHNLSKTNSVFSNFIAEIRDAEIQKDPLRFRRNLERIAEILGYELSKKLEFELEIGLNLYRNYNLNILFLQCKLLGVRPQFQ